MSDVLSTLEMLDLAVARASGIVDLERLERAGEIARRVRDRRGFLGETLVLAIAGGTGSGKSSLLNAIAEEKVARAGVLRPTTDSPLAWIPEVPEPGIVELLDGLGIEDRVEQTRFPRLAVIDLPDYDSIVGEHQKIVERMLPEVDGVIWVLDPEKYRDPLIHEGYLLPLTEYQDQFLFVLNQIDRLGDEELAAVEADLVRALREDGIDSPHVFSLAADPSDGVPLNIDRMRAYLAERLNGKAMAAGKLLGDMRTGARLLRDGAGVEQGSGVDFEGRWSEVRSSVVASLTPGADSEAAAGFEEVLCRLGDFVTALSVETRALFGERLRTEFSHDRLEKDLQAAIEEAWAVGDPAGAAVRQPGRLRSWFRRSRRREPQTDEAAPVPPGEVLAKEVEDRIGRPLRALMWERSLLTATLASLEIESRLAERALAR